MNASEVSQLCHIYKKGTNLDFEVHEVSSEI